MKKSKFSRRRDPFSLNLNHPAAAIDHSKEAVLLQVMIEETGREAAVAAEVVHHHIVQEKAL